MVASFIILFLPTVAAEQLRGDDRWANLRLLFLVGTRTQPLTSQRGYSVGFVARGRELLRGRMRSGARQTPMRLLIATPEKVCYDTWHADNITPCCSIMIMMEGCPLRPLFVPPSLFVSVPTVTLFL